MTDVFTKLSPIILIFVLGILLRTIRVVGRDDAALMLKIVFYVALPALILLSVPDVDITRDLVLLPISAAIIIITTGLFALLVYRPIVGERPVLGVVLVGVMIMNTSFLYPFFLVVYGNAGFARAVAFDVGNGLLVFTLVYYVACRCGDAGHPSWSALRRLVAAPPLWAFGIGLMLNVTDIPIHSNLRAFLASVGNLLVPLVMLALGIYFSPRLVRWRLLLTVLIIRTCGGLGLGLLLVGLFGLEGLSRSIVLVCAAAPIGFNTLVFSSMTKLDVDFAASLLSTSIMLGIVYVPMIITFVTPS